MSRAFARSEATFAEGCASHLGLFFLLVFQRYIVSELVLAAHDVALDETVDESVAHHGLLGGDVVHASEELR